MTTHKELLERIIEENLTWMKENEIHYCEVKTPLGHRFNLFDCRRPGLYRFIASMPSIILMVGYVQEHRDELTLESRPRETQRLNL